MRVGKVTNGLGDLLSTLIKGLITPLVDSLLDLLALDVPLPALSVRICAEKYPHWLPVA